MAQGFEQQHIKCAPFSLVRGLSGDLVQDEGGQSARGEQVSIAPQPFERVPPVGFVAYRGAFLFYVVNRQHLIGEHHLGSGQAAQPQHPLRILVLQLAALERLRQHERATHKEGRCLDISFAAGKVRRARRYSPICSLLAGMRRGHT